MYSNIYRLSFGTKDMYPINTKQLENLEMIVDNISGGMTKNFINKDKNKTRIMVFLKDLSNNTLKELDDYVKKFNEKNDDLRINITGAQYLMYELNLNIIDGQNTSMLIAMIAIFILLLLSLKKLKPAIAAIIPILITSFVLSGFLGVSSISLNLITVTIFSVTLGVGIDYAIHFTSVWLSCMDDGKSKSEATDVDIYVS